MPKAAVNENDELVPGKDQVRLPWQVTPMQPEAEAHRMQKPPHNQLWLGVGRSDARHQRTSFRIDTEEIYFGGCCCQGLSPPTEPPTYSAPANPECSAQSQGPWEAARLRSPA